jgi:hypothetical protein
VEIFFDEWTAGTLENYDSSSKSFSVKLQDGSLEDLDLADVKAHVVLPGQQPLSSPLGLMSAMDKALQDKGVFVRMASTKDAKTLASLHRDFHLEMARLGEDGQVPCMDTKVHADESLCRLVARILLHALPRIGFSNEHMQIPQT